MECDDEFEAEYDDGDTSEYEKICTDRIIEDKSYEIFDFITEYAEENAYSIGDKLTAFKILDFIQKNNYQ